MIVEELLVSFFFKCNQNYNLFILKVEAKLIAAMEQSNNVGQGPILTRVQIIIIIRNNIIIIINYNSVVILA